MEKTLWNEDKTTGAFLGACIAALVLLGGGSYWPGWQLDSTATERMREGQKTALVRVLAPVCAEKFRKQQNLTAQTAMLKEVKSWERDKWLVDEKWVVPTGAASTDKAVGDACADMLDDLTK